MSGDNLLKVINDFSYAILTINKQLVTCNLVYFAFNY